MLRGGAFKPRTSPYDFQGLKADGIELLLEAKRETGLPIVTEIMNANYLDLFEDVDLIQVGARNMQKALLCGLLEPFERIRACETDWDFSGRLALGEEARTLPWGAVWNYYCLTRGVPPDAGFMNDIRSYEQEVTLLRG